MERPTLIKDKSALAYIEFLEKNLAIYVGSPYTESYITFKKLVDTINNQIQKLDISIDSDDSEKLSKKINAAAKQLESYIDTLDSLRVKMNPAEVERANAEVKKMLTKEDGVEEFLNANKK